MMAPALVADAPSGVIQIAVNPLLLAKVVRMSLVVETSPPGVFI